MSVKINGMAVYEYGEKNNRPIIFIHGFPFNGYMWRAQFSNFKNDYRCIAYDLRGFGASELNDATLTIESFVDDLFVLMDDMKLDKPIACGLSMGGYILLRAVERNEARFGGIILCDTKSEADSNEVKIKRAINIKKIDQFGAEKFVEDFVPTTMNPESIVNLGNGYSHLLNLWKTTSAKSLKAALLAMAARTDTTSYLNKIEIPTLLICGEKDSLTPPEVMQAMQIKIKNSQIVIVKNSAHLAPLENKDETNLAIHDFLQGNFPR